MSDHPQRHFAPPSDIKDNGACFIVRITAGRRSHTCTMRRVGRAAANLLTRDEARASLNMAKLPDFLIRPQY
jgi:hypothetical protein